MTLLIWSELSSKNSGITLMGQEREGNARAFYQHVSESQVKTMVVCNFFVQSPLTKTLNSSLLIAESKSPHFLQVLTLGDIFLARFFARLLLFFNSAQLFLITLTHHSREVFLQEKCIVYLGLFQTSASFYHKKRVILVLT